jgi:diguanylate cyclase
VKKTDSKDGENKTSQKPTGASAGSSASAADKSQEIAVAALEKIEALGLKPIPQLYELWFRYYQGDPEIVQALNQHAGQLDEVTCHKVYKRYLSETSRDEAVRKISDQIQHAMAGIVTMLTNAKAASTEYGDQLTDMDQKLKDATSIEDLSEIVSAIAEDTRRMVEKNQALELQLVSSSQQVNELRQNLDSVKKEAMTDGLTGLTNRKAFDKYIRDCVEDAATTGLPLVLLMLDIDHFKNFNDTFGHQTGDQVLRLVARTLTDGVKGRDTAARYGGEEFAIILPDTPLPAGVKVGEALRRNIEGKEVVNKMNQKHLGQITLSVGVAEYYPGESISDFIGRADAALYEAKRGGRNRVTTARPPN